MNENSDNKDKGNSNSHEDSLLYDENHLKREADFFKFHPYSFIDDVHESTHDYCADSADFIESCLLGHPLFNNNQEFKQLIQEGTNNVWELLEQIFTKNLNKYEEYLLSSILNIPEDLILPDEQPINNNNSTKYKNNSDGNNNSKLYNRSNIIDKEMEDLRTNIQKLTNENDQIKNKIQTTRQDIKLLQSINTNLKTESKNIENIAHINQKRKVLEYNYQVLKSKLSNTINSDNNNNNNINKSLLEKMINLNLKTVNECTIIESSNIIERVEKSV
ncbi:hypothetical protein ACTA71_001896 [Dictyostelium dimigraforme]